MTYNLRSIYKIMHKIADERYFVDYNDYIGELASDTAIARYTNQTADPAIWYEWLSAVANVDISEGLSDEAEAEIEKTQLTLEEGYAAAIRFLTWYANSVDSDEIRTFVQGITYEKWLEAAEKS